MADAVIELDIDSAKAQRRIRDVRDSLRDAGRAGGEGIESGAREALRGGGARRSFGGELAGATGLGGTLGKAALAGAVVAGITEALRTFAPQFIAGIQNVLAPREAVQRTSARLGPAFEAGAVLSEEQLRREVERDLLFIQRRQQQEARLRSFQTGMIAGEALEAGLGVAGQRFPFMMPGMRWPWEVGR